jgi:hypothetical protein
MSCVIKELTTPNSGRWALTKIDRLDACCKIDSIKIAIMADITHITVRFFDNNSNQSLIGRITKTIRLCLSKQGKDQESEDTSSTCEYGRAVCEFAKTLKTTSKQHFSEAVDYLYSRLAIIDSKSVALLQSNALIAAVASIIFSQLSKDNNLYFKLSDMSRPVVCLLLMLSILTAAFGALLSLRAARLKFEQISNDSDPFIKEQFVDQFYQPNNNCENTNPDPGLTYVLTIMIVTAIRVDILRFARILAVISVWGLIGAIAVTGIAIA